MLKVYFSNITSLFDEKKYLNVYNSLPSFRQRKADEYSRYIDKIRSVASFYLLIKLLNDNNIEFDEKLFKIDKNGKPYFLNNVVYFNIAHSGNYVIAGISDSPIGVDVEIIKKDDKEKLLKYVFNDIELKKYNTCKNPLSFFYFTWTKKESYSKFIGLGLGINFNKINFLDSKNKSLTFKTFKSDEHYFSVCSKNKNIDLIKKIKIA